MRTFKRFKTLDELREECKKRGWRLDSSKHDNEGHDHVVVHFNVNGYEGHALYNTFNGRFFGTLYVSGAQFSSDTDKFGKAQWFNALLDTFYVEKE